MKNGNYGLVSKNNMLSNLVEPVTLFVSTGLWGSLQALSTGRHRKICHSKLYAWTVSFRNVWPTMSLEHGTTNGRFLLNIRTQHSQQRCFLRFFSLQSQLHLGLWPVIWRGRLAIRMLLDTSGPKYSKCLSTPRGSLIIRESSKNGNI